MGGAPVRRHRTPRSGMMESGVEGRKEQEQAEWREVLAIGAVEGNLHAVSQLWDQ